MKDDQDEAPAKGLDQSKLIAAVNDSRDHVSLNLHLHHVPDLGLWNPNIKEAAELVALDMWFSGIIEGVNEPEDFDGDHCASWLLDALADTIAEFEAQLLGAVDSGRLKASFVRRSLDKQLIPEQTHIQYSDLVDWLEGRSYELGDHMDGWIYTESELSKLICDELIFLRATDRSGRNELKHIAIQRASTPWVVRCKRTTRRGAKGTASKRPRNIPTERGTGTMLIWAT